MQEAKGPLERHPQGGSNIMYQKLITYIDPKYLTKINLILNDASFDKITPHTKNIFWNHHNVDQDAIKLMSNQDFVNNIDYFIYVSHWQYEKFRDYYRTPEARSLVIQNAVDGLLLLEKPKKIKLIYTSTPWRGLELLLDVFELLARDDIELDIYSSTAIYGQKFYIDNDRNFSHLYDRAKSIKGINYLGFQTNSTVRKALSEAHILAYPCIWEETSCMAAIEAGMAGLNIVTTNIGALPETCGAWAKFVSYDANKRNLIRKFSHALDSSINKFWSEENQDKLRKQSDYFNRFFSWDSRIPEWENFLKQIT